MEGLQNFRGVLYFEAILFVILGIIGIAVPQFFTIGVELLVGSLFLAGGIVQIIRLFQSKGAPGYGSTLFSALLSLIIGGLLLFFPIAGVISLTYLLIAYFLIDGCAKIYLAFQLKSQEKWGWILFSGLLSLALAALIFSGLPGSAIWVIGLLVGINMLFFGFSLFSIAAAL